MKSIALAIYSKPKPNGAAETAYDLAQSLLSLGHKVSRLFFFHDGVYNATDSHSISLPQRWSQLIQSHSIDAVVCVASAEQRGIKPSPSHATENKLLPGFQIAGLAQLVDASKNSDHLLTFSD